MALERGGITMKSWLTATMGAALAAIWSLTCSVAVAADSARLVPSGRQPVPIENHQYPRSYFPNTELLGAGEMRVIALGTGRPVITKAQKSASWWVELGNGDSFLFDVGSGSLENLSVLRPDWSRMDKVFLSHLHIDHAGDLDVLLALGWLNGRYTPLQIHGPSGSTPELGTAAFVAGQRASWAWDILGRASVLPDAGGQLEAHEFDYRQTQLVYEQNGVKISAFPAIHLMDGSVSYRLDWNGLSFVFGGDSIPNKWFIENSQDADLVVHECYFLPEQYQRFTGFSLRRATIVTSYIHTPPEGFGKIMSAIEPRMAVAYHFWPQHDLVAPIYDRIRSTYDGPLTIAKDLLVWNVTNDHIEVREAIVDEAAWPTGVSAEFLRAPRTDNPTRAMSEYIRNGQWEEFTPPPLPDE
jgi:ribonuclease Z